MPGFFYSQREFAYARLKDDYPREYSVWAHLHQRRKHKGYKVAEHWKVFTNFLQDMGKIPSKDFYLKRIDASLPFQPGNCKWEPFSQEYLQKQLENEQTKLQLLAENNKAQRKQKIKTRMKKTLYQQLGYKRLHRDPNKNKTQPKIM